MTEADQHKLSWFLTIRAWFKQYPLIGDVTYTLVNIGVGLGIWILNVSYDPKFFTPIASEAIPWLILGALPLVVRRTRLWWAVAGVLIVSIASALEPTIGLTSGFTSVVITYTVASVRSLRRALWLSAAMWVVITLTSLTPADTKFSVSQLVVGLFYTYASMSISFGIGRAVHNRRKNLAELQQRAELAEQNQESLAAQAVADERRRIARELHDVVAHHISVMGVMATGARRTLSKDPAKADQALATIETTGRATLREMRRLLDVLRTTEEPADDELTPQPSLDGVHALVSQIRDAGLPVNLSIIGEPYPLDSGIALTVFRIVQECLTNTLKHAGPAKAGVRISYDTDEISLEVSDTGVGQKVFDAEPRRVGHGLVGMRERVALYGGSLRTGPRPGGGFRVHAVIPIDNPVTPETIDGGNS